MLFCFEDKVLGNFIFYVDGYKFKVESVFSLLTILFFAFDNVIFYVTTWLDLQCRQGLLRIWMQQSCQPSHLLSAVLENCPPRTVSRQNCLANKY